MAKSKIQQKIQEEAIEHIEVKQAELTAKAETELVWYKKVGYYVAAGIGGTIITLINAFGDTIFDAINQALSNLF